MQGTNRLDKLHPRGHQFIVRRNTDDGGLPYSAEFYLNDEVWKLSGQDCLLMSPGRYSAKVTVEGTVDLDKAVGFEEALRNLLKQLKVEEVLLDDEQRECNEAKRDLEMSINDLVSQPGDRKRDVMLLYRLLKKHDQLLNVDFMHDLRNCSHLSSEISSKLDSYVAKVLKLIQRNEVLGQFNYSLLYDDFIYPTIQRALYSYRVELLSICPASMEDKVWGLSDDCILNVTVNDMHLFRHLTTMDELIFRTALPMIFSKFQTRVETIDDEHCHECRNLISDLHGLSDRIFLHVCLVIQEVVKLLGTNRRTDPVIIYSEACGWKITNQQEESQSSKWLKQQLQMLAELANHFGPGSRSRLNCFPFKFILRPNMDSVVRILLVLLENCLDNLIKAYVRLSVNTLECQQTIALQSPAFEYYKMIRCFVNKFPPSIFLTECVQIEAMLQQIICIAMDLKVSSDELSKFSNTFKQLLNELGDLQLEWFIQLTPSDKRSFFQRSQLYVIPVNSIWQDTKYEFFKVVEVDDFVEMYKRLHKSGRLPKHYQLEVIQMMLQKLEKLAQTKQTCNDDTRLSDQDLVNAMIAVINSIQSSLNFFKEQPDYCCFEDFRLKMSKLSAQVVDGKVQDMEIETCSGAIDSGEVLDPLLYCFKGSISRERLENGLKLYTTQFNKYITGSAQLSREQRIEQIVLHVRSKIVPNLATSWTEEFKRNELPEILAGLSAVWSIIVSEKDGISEKMTEATQLQLGCILSIFGDQKSYKTEHKTQHHKPQPPRQLIQMATQQGKEFALGLTAALLALYGHKVHIVCFNTHLTRIKSSAWIELFRSFSILSNISYESLADMARDRSKGIYQKYTAYINKCFGFENNDNESENASEDKRPILLVEDIEIILQELTKYEAFMRFISLPIPGLMQVQRMLFCQNGPVNGNDIDRYIEQSDNPNIRQLRTFLDRPHSYSYLISEGNRLKEAEHTNKTLFSEHLEAMKSAATMKEYCLSVLGTSSGENKYGYLPLGCIHFPYEYLLEHFPLVLGFTSAPLKDIDLIFLLYKCDIYHTISESKILLPIPNIFDSTKDFHCVDSEDERDWIEAIIVAIQAAIDRNCLVLVFLKNTQEMDKFQQSEYLKQLNVTAIKTASNGENVSEYDILQDDICVLMVSNGRYSKDLQIHVIQTFFSDDAKEEALIRRQAERGHISGSYELIISRTNMNYARQEEITYSRLADGRVRHYFNYKNIKNWPTWNVIGHNDIKDFLAMKRNRDESRSSIRPRTSESWRLKRRHPHDS